MVELTSAAQEQLSKEDEFLQSAVSLPRPNQNGITSVLAVFMWLGLIVKVSEDNK